MFFLPFVSELESLKKMALPFAQPALYKIRVVNAREVSEIIVNITSQAKRHLVFREDFLVAGPLETTSMYIGSKLSSPEPGLFS